MNISDLVTHFWMILHQNKDFRQKTVHVFVHSESEVAAFSEERKWPIKSRSPSNTFNMSLKPFAILKTYGCYFKSLESLREEMEKIF